MKWLTTFNDMVTLLLVFFVLLFSMSSLDPEKAKSFKAAMQSALGVLEAGQRTAVSTAPELSARVDPPPDTATKTQSADAAAGRPAAWSEVIRQLETESGVQTSVTPEGVLITLDDRLLFETGVAALNPEGRLVLARVGAVIGAKKQPIRVEGHTDNRSIQSSRYPSNWELATARAVNVVKYFIQHTGMAPHRLSAVGYGASKPLFANDTPVQRAKNRRVEIVLAFEEER